MPQSIHFPAVAVTAVASFVASAIYYGLFFGGMQAELAGLDSTVGMSAGQIAAQFLRDAIVTTALAAMFAWTRADGLSATLRVGLLIWFGFEAMAIAGAVIHENYPLQLYLIHSVDALMKTLIVSTLLGLWRGRAAVRA